MELTSQHKLRDSVTGFFIPVFQVFKSLSHKHSGILVFFILPLVYLLNATAIHYNIGAFFLVNVDPEYFYLFNGLVLSGGNLSIQYFAHPGTPLHFIIAISSRIIDIFQPGDYVKDFVDDPEKYIHAANLLMNVLISLVLFICGIYAKKYSGSYFAGLMIQLLPFGSSVLLGLSGRLIPESLMMLPLLLISLMIIKNIFNDHKTNGSFSDIVLYGLIIGFGVACKLSFIPLLLIPLILLSISLRQKIKLILYSTLFFAIFAYPVVFNFNEFWQWVSGIFTHSGKYGGGEKNIIDFATVPGNIRSLFDNNKEFFYVAIFSVLTSLLFSFKVFKNRSLVHLKITRAIFAVNISILVCIVFTLKHFELYYFMPFSIFKYLLVLLSALLIIQHQKIANSKRYKSIAISSISVIVLIMTYGQVTQTKQSVLNIRQRSELMQKEYKKITSIVEKGRPLIFSGDYYGAPFIEFAECSGFIMCKHLKGFFTPYLKEKFPGSYQYLSWSDKLYFWDDFVDFDHVLDRTKTSFYIYIGKEKGNDLAEIENRLWKFLDKSSITRKVLYQEVNTDAQLIEFIIDSKTQNSELKTQN